MQCSIIKSVDAVAKYAVSVKRAADMPHRMMFTVDESEVLKYTFGVVFVITSSWFSVV
jgi:hypothetical protein